LTTRIGSLERAVASLSLRIAELKVDLSAIQSRLDTMDRRMGGGLRERATPRTIRAARIRGYEGDSCEECGNFTLIRNGTRFKCDTCGATSGCS
jgi:hypothetical protein